MAVPYVVTATNPGGAGEWHSLPSQAQPGDLILLVVRHGRRLSDQSGGAGSYGTHTISGATAALGVVASSGASWQEWKPNSRVGYIYRGEAVRTQVRAATVPEDPGAVRVRYTVPFNYNSSGAARLVIVRNAAGVGASNTSQWRVPTSSDQSLGFFAGSPFTPPAGVTDISVGTGPPAMFTAPSTGPHAGPGGSIDTSGDRSLVHLLGLEIVGTSGPGEPVITDPVDGSQVANGVPVEVAWEHRPARPGGHQGAYRLVVTTAPQDPDEDPVNRWWDGLGLVATETTVESSVSRVELPPSVIGQDATLSVAVATREALDGEWSLYSAGSSFSSVEPPTVTVTGPTGAVHNTMRPVIEWDGQAAPGEVLVQFHARIADADGVFVFDSGGQQGSPGVFAAPALSNWVNGAEYVPWVRVRQTGGAWSAWEHGEPFLVTWDEPAAPAVSAAPGRHGVEITVEDPTIAPARQALVDALAAYTDAPVQWSTTEPGDTSVVWVDPGSGVARQWSAGVGGSVDDVVTRNLVTNPRGRDTDGTVVVIPNYEGTESPDPDLELVDGDLVAPAPVGWTAGGGGVVYYSASRDMIALRAIGAVPTVATFTNDVPPAGTGTAVALVEGATGDEVGVFAGWPGGGTVALTDTVQEVRATGNSVEWASGFALGGNPEVGATVYFRMLATEGEYDGDYFDGDTPERRTDNIIYRYAWDDEPHASPSTETALGQGWHEITDPDVVAAGEAYEQAVGGAELAAEVQRADGDDWVPVALAAQGGTAIDVLAPYSQQVTYRARTTATIADVTVYSDWAHSGPTVNTDRYAYLADANDPARWVRLVLAQAVPHEHPRQIETAHGLGDRVPMVNKGPELAKTGAMTVRTATRDEEDRLIALLQETPRLVFRRPAEQRYAGNTPWHDRGTTVLTVNTGIDVEPIADNYPLTLRRVSFGWVEQ